jgi:hypothetical protein
LHDEFVGRRMLEMEPDDRKTLQVLFGSPSASVIRLRGWERYAFLAFAIAGVVAAVLAVASLLGVSISNSVVQWAQVIVGATAVAAVTGVACAMARYQGETTELPPSRANRLVARFTKRAEDDASP